MSAVLAQSSASVSSTSSAPAPAASKSASGGIAAQPVSGARDAFQQPFVPLHLRPSFSIFGDATTSAALHATHVNSVDSHTFSHTARTLSLLSHQSRRQSADINNPNVISVFPHEFDPSEKRFHRRQTLMESRHYPDAQFNTQATVWDKKLNRLSQLSREAALAGPLAASKFKTLLSQEPKVQRAKGLPPSPLLTMSLARAARPDEKAESEFLDAHLSASQQLRTGRGISVRSLPHHAIHRASSAAAGAGAGAGAQSERGHSHRHVHLPNAESRPKTAAVSKTVRSQSPRKRAKSASAVRPQNGDQAGPVIAQHQPRPLYPYGSSSAFPYAPYDYRCHTAHMRD